MPNHEDEKWRVSFARILLCIAMLFYLVMLAAIPIGQPSPRGTSTLVSLSSIVGLSAFAALAINRMRRTSIAAIGLLALLTMAALVRAAFQLGFPVAPVKTNLDQIEVMGILIIAMASMAAPILELIVVWPMRHGFSAIASSVDVTQDNSAAHSNPPAVPPA
jgi:hypothetical protein